jgi:hypothetical protein
MINYYGMVSNAVLGTNRVSAASSASAACPIEDLFYSIGV